MEKYKITKSQLEGELTVPPSKSHTLRALTFALLANGITRIRNFLQSPDTKAMVNALKLMGASVDISNNEILVRGTSGRPCSAEDVIDCGNSGQVLRFMGALAGLASNYTVFTGDYSIRNSRPAAPLLEGLSQLGAFAVSTRENGFAPIVVRGPFTRKIAEIDGQDSQPVSGLIIAAAFAKHPIELRVRNPGEKPWIAMTLYWLEKLGVPYRNERFEKYLLNGNASIHGFETDIPADFSSAAFPIAAALITHSELTLQGLDMNDPQGDKMIIAILERMGARFEIDHKKKILRVKKTSKLNGIAIDCNDFVDALPILAVIGCFAEGQTILFNASIARNKESNRIRCMASELKKMGADIKETEDGLIIRQSKLQGATLETYHDHRLVLSLSVAGLGAEGETIILGIDAAKKTYPSFLNDFRSIQANIEISK